MSHYETAVVCRNGHVVTSGRETSPELAAPHCPQCGMPTVSACAGCGASIRGDYIVSGVIGSWSVYHPPGYCHHCGVPYPWTQAATEAWRKMAQDAEGLTDDEKQKLAASIDDLISDTPRTALAIQHTKRFFSKMAGAVPGMMKEVLVSMATEAARKGLGL